MLIGFEDEREDEGAGDPAAEGAADDEESRREFPKVAPTLPPTTAEAAPRVNVKEVALPRQQSAKYRSIHYRRIKSRAVENDGDVKFAPGRRQERTTQPLKSV